MTKFFYLIFAILIFINFDVTSQDTVALDKVEIVSVPFAENWINSGGNIHIMQTGDIDKHLQPSVQALYNQVPGIFLHQGSQNTTRLTIRGIGSRSPYNSTRVKAYFNDIPLTSGDGITIIEDIEPRQIGKIEVVRGPASAVYGSGLGGSINLSSTTTFQDGPGATTESNAGNFGLLQNYFNMYFRRNSLSLNASVNHKQADGFRENSQFNKNSVLINSRYLKNRQNIQFTLAYIDMKAYIPSSTDKNTFINSPSSAATNWLNINGYEQYKKLIGGITHHLTFNSTTSNAITIFGSYSKLYESRPFDILSQEGNYYGLRERFNISISKWKNQVGFEYFNENLNWQKYTTEGGKQQEQFNNNVELRSHFNLFYHTSIEPIDDLQIEAGINYNSLNYKLKDRFNDSIDKSGNYFYDPVISPRVGINYQYIRNHAAYISVSHGFSMPTLEETLLPEGEINTNLKPEEGWNYETGLKGLLPNYRLIYSVAIYQVNLNNLLVTKRLSEDIFTGINAGKTVHKGMEIWTKTSLLPKKSIYSLNVTASYTISKNQFLEFTDENINYDGNELPGIPNQQLSISSEFKFPFELHLNLLHRYTGSQYMNDANTKKYGGYHLTDLTITKHLNIKNSKITIYTSLNNLFDTHYASMILINAPTIENNAPRYYYSGNPRNYILGIKVFW